MKYGTWNVSTYDEKEKTTLCVAGYSPLTAAVLCSRGYTSPAAAREFLATDCVLFDPMLLREMDAAASRVRLAVSRGEYIAVFGDYDVDGITATCLLTEFLRSMGAKVRPYIPARIEEGYGLNEPAIRTLKSEGVELIVTVDCGITADAEAALCRAEGIDLVITDHHECKDVLPEACAVVDPHRKDHTYPHQGLAGVGVAFKLASAICGDQERILREYCDLVCLGTVADVMPLTGENRAIVARGLAKMTAAPRLGLAALIRECGCEGQPVTSALIGYTLAPRINAAGRMGQVHVATELFLTNDAGIAAEKAAALCKMNRQRQSVECEIYKDAVQRLSREAQPPEAIVLAGEDWHQGVVGIVASRLAEEYSCPTFLICMDGDKGKASSRSYGGFNLFGALESLSDLLESYGGHELAAGFTIRRENIDRFREEILRLSEEFKHSGKSRLALPVDCEVTPALLSIKNVDALDELEPCGTGCPKPTFFMSGLKIDQLSAVGGGKHLRLKLTRDGASFGAIFFSTTAMDAGVAVGDLVEAAFAAQINEFRGSRTVQLSLVDLRQDGATRRQQAADRDLYARLFDGSAVGDEECRSATPTRAEFVAVWKYLTVSARGGRLEDSVECLARKAYRAAGLPCSLIRAGIVLRVFEELGLLKMQKNAKSVHLLLCEDGRKVDLTDSQILAKLKEKQAGD